jgi:hypothetical protein
MWQIVYHFFANPAWLIHNAGLRANPATESTPLDRFRLLYGNRKGDHEANHRTFLILAGLS